jgi:two-component system sensor kinase FixL
MTFALPKAPRAINIAGIFLLIVTVAVVDWRVHADVPLALVYLLPIAFAGALLTRLQIAILAAICAALAEWFDDFPWLPQTALPRDILYVCAFCGIGLFVHEVLANRRRGVLHTNDLEKEIRARRDIEEQLDILIGSSPIAILTADSDGRILLANDAAHRLLAVDPATLPGQRIDTYLPSLLTVPAFRDGQPSFRTVMQCRGQRHDGDPFIAEVWFSTYLTSAGPRLAAMVVDTSQDLRDREEANLHHLLAGSRILVGAVSHEVRNVCGAIAVVHQNLARTAALQSNKDFDALGTLVLALERIASLDLREAVQRPTPLDLHSFLDELKVMVGPTLRDLDIEEIWSFPDLLPPVWADRQSLMQVFLNLVRNSQAALVDRHVRRLTFSTTIDPARVSIAISDTGPGVQHPELLFRPFHQISHQVGLGLYLSRALMRSFKGDLRHQPTDNGATFIVDLPRVLETTPQ